MSEASCLASNSEPPRACAQRNFMVDVVAGLTSQQKSLNAKYFYDQRGSAYFDEICELAEYYIFKTELGLLPRVARELSKLVPGPKEVVEFGAGSVHKIVPVLKYCPDIERFTAMDISAEHLDAACSSLAQTFSNVDVNAIAGDFTKPIALAACDITRVGFFPGSTIGNFTPTDAREFLCNARLSLGEDAYFLIGVDTKKSPETLHRAYNDASGVTAKFNLNILQRINQELDADFELQKFEHYAYYNASQGRIEMHLVSLDDQRYCINDAVIEFSRGESIHTENSYKYTPHEFRQLAARAGWHCLKTWLAEDDMFAMYLLRV